MSFFISWPLSIWASKPPSGLGGWRETLTMFRSFRKGKCTKIHAALYVFLVAPCICFDPFVWRLQPWQTTFSLEEKHIFQFSAGLEASRLCFEFFFQDVFHIVPQPDFRQILLLFPERSTSCFWEALPDTPNFSWPHNLTPTWPNLAHSRKKSSRRHRP